MTRDEFRTEYARATAKSDWRRALAAVETRIEHAEDADELECLGAKFNHCKSRMPIRLWPEAWYRRERAT